MVDLAAGAVADQFGNPSVPFSAAFYLGRTNSYVVNDGSPDRIYEYGLISNSFENCVLNRGNFAPRGAEARIGVLRRSAPVVLGRSPRHNTPALDSVLPRG